MGVEKDYVNYKIASADTKKKCATCDNFYPPGAFCELVDGNISPEAICDRYHIGGGKSDGPGLSKESVEYAISKKKKKRCKTCDNFYPPGAKCELVEGNISPEAVCVKYHIGGRRTAGRDATYYKNQRKRAGK